MTLLSIQNLSIRFSEKEVVQNVSFSIYPGQTFALVGESGSGKSTLALSLVGLLPTHAKTSGEILYKGNPFNPSKLRGKEIGIIFQDPLSALNPTMKIGAQIQEGVKIYYPHLSSKLLKEKVLELLSLVEISDPLLHFNYYPHMLSGGMRQRVLIAIALSQNPALLIADEPTTALDVTTQAEILSLLKKIQKERQMSILFITHDLSIVHSFCDVVLVMYQGRSVESSSVFSLFSNPEHLYTIKLLNASRKKCLF